MTSLAASYSRPRKSYAKNPSSVEFPYLIELQHQSYKDFLQANVSPEQRQNVGLEGVFSSVFPISDFAGLASIQYVSYSFEEPKYAVEECRYRGVTYASSLKVIVQLVTWDLDKETSIKSIRDVKEQEVYFGEIPLMTDSGTFVINGIERVIVSQLHRSSGVFFDNDRGKGTASGKLLYTARIIPYRGSWLDFEFDSKDILYIRIDRRRKLHATVLLKALGYDNKGLLDYFYQKETIQVEGDSFYKFLNFELMRGQRAKTDMLNKAGEVIVKKNRRITPSAIKQLQKEGVEKILINDTDLIGKIVGKNILSDDGGTIIDANSEIEEDHIALLRECHIESFEILFIDNVNVDDSLRVTLLNDKIQTSEEAVIEIYKRMRPGDPPTFEAAKNFFESFLFNPDRYDLGAVGRLKLNERLGLNSENNGRILTKEDILKTVQVLLQLKTTQGEIDDIDHLGNRRVRPVGELLENQYRIGLLRIERAVRERLQASDIESHSPHDFINNKPASAVIREFFGSSQLSQFMDQTNPLSEVTHKRRLSALGPGGLNRERAGFEVRDVHSTHYGRICPIETPEGPNIGLISSLATYAKVNRYGFIETPYKKLKDQSVRYYTATEEHCDHVIAQAAVDGSYRPDDFIVARRAGENETVRAEETDLMDVSPQQLVSVAASLIPFLQNDDANRALMGSNMMRQAVPLLTARAPLVGTGMERLVSRDSGASIIAKKDGIVEFVDANHVVVKTTENSEDETEVGADVDIYSLNKYKRSNIDTCINQKTLVNRGEHVRVGDTIADGFATEGGELALGQNIVVAFMPWNGYNFEDSILISEKMVKEDFYTSIHIQEFECVARDTKLGQEEITSDIPSISEEALANLDEAGIIRIGAEVTPNDLLVGKITPKGETQLTPEEKLLRAIFGEKAADVRNTSLRVPPGVVGTVIDVNIFSREGTEKDFRRLQIEEKETGRLKRNEKAKISIIKDSAASKIYRFLKDEPLAGDLLDLDEKLVFHKGAKLSLKEFSKIDYRLWGKVLIGSLEKSDKISKIIYSFKEKVNLIRYMSEEQIKNLKKGDELPPGVIKMVKVYVAIKRKLSVGDKMAGRHGNKGVVSRILPEEDMPYLENGQPVDIVLNPLGVPSRMNVGQILETHLGWAVYSLGEKINHALKENYPREELERLAKSIWNTDDVRDLVEDFLQGATDEELRVFLKKYRKGVHVANPVFDGVCEQDIEDALELAGVSKDGKVCLFDGRTGNMFRERITVGVMYMLKLHHLVDEKIHSRSIGPYSLVTQQPLGGKAQFGGQRLGEMEVWAMEAYGAAFLLQEFLTVKSDDVSGRTRMYESIVKGRHTMTPGLPESFNVLIKELQSLSLNVDLQRYPENVVDEAKIASAEEAIVDSSIKKDDLI